MKRAGLLAAGLLTLGMFAASCLAMIDRYLPTRHFGEDVMDLLGAFGGLVAIFYELHLSLTDFLQSWPFILEALLLAVWLLASTRLLRLAMGR